MIAPLTTNAKYSFVTYVEAILNIKNDIPPKIKGLNLITSPVVVVAMPATNNINGGGFIPNLIQINAAIKNEGAVTHHRLSINLSKEQAVVLF